MPSLPDYPWKISYCSDSDNPLLDFYVPALERSTQYDRKSGFFNSAILSHIAGGLGVMLHQAGKIRLILGCQLNAQDVAAIKKGYDLRDAILTRLDADLTPPQNFAQLHHFEILSWLIAGDRLDIRIAIPLKPNGDPQLAAETLDFNDPLPQALDQFLLRHPSVSTTPSRGITDPTGQWSNRRRLSRTR